MSLLRKHRLRIRLNKCFFMRRRVELLDHVIHKHGVYTDDKKVQKIRCAQSPHDAKELRSFLVLASFYRRFIQGFAKIASRLSEKTSEKAELEKIDDMRAAIDNLKEALTTAPALAYPDFGKPFIVATAASCRAILAVLSQKDDNWREHPIHYAGLVLKNVERNYSTYERESLAIVFALKKFRYYLLCQQFKLFTDHEALKYVIKTRDQPGRIARWMSLCAEYDFDLQYRPGLANANADCLSRSSTATDSVLSMGLEDDLKPVFEYLTTRMDTVGSPRFAMAIKVGAKNYVKHYGQLYRRNT